MLSKITHSASVHFPRMYKATTLKTFFYQKRFHFSPSFFNVIGSGLIVSSITILRYAKKLESTQKTLLIFIAGIIALLGMTSLYACNQIMDTEEPPVATRNVLQKNPQKYLAVTRNVSSKDVEENLARIRSVSQKYEKKGDYATALSLARAYYKKPLQLKTKTDDWVAIQYLEKQLVTLGSSRLFFDENEQPRPKLLQLLAILGMPPLTESEPALAAITRWTQDTLLRQGEQGQEQINTFEPLKRQITPLIQELGFVNASSAHCDNYKGAIIHGALLPTIRLRLHHLITQWEKGIRFSHIYFLSGERPLEEQQENEELLIRGDNSPLKIKKEWKKPERLPKTECEMIQMVWEQSAIPERMRKTTQVHFINAPMKAAPNDEPLLQPTTDDSVACWLNTEPHYGQYLVVTNAPYTHRQDIVMRRLAPQYDFDTIGTRMSKKISISLLLDEIARYIFQIHLYHSI